MMTTVYKKCKNCGKPTSGRSDKKFCSASCKNDYNNVIRRKNAFHRSIDRALLKNRNIIIALLDKGQTKIKREALIKKGFNFSVHTEIAHTTKGAYYFIYDVGYFPVYHNDQQIAWLVKRKEYVGNLIIDPWD